MSHHGHRRTEFERVVAAKSPFGVPVRRIQPLTLEQERDWDIAVATGHWPAVRKQAPLTDREAARLAHEEMEVEFGPETPQGERFSEITNAPGAIIPVRQSILNEAAKAYYAEQITKDQHERVLAMDRAGLFGPEEWRPPLTGRTSEQIAESIGVAPPWLDLNDPDTRIALTLIFFGVALFVVLL